MMANGMFGGGNGTPSNPYLVEDGADLIAVSKHLRASFLQTADIDLSSFTNWCAIGVGEYNPNSTVPYENFRGKYDGGNFEISNLRSNQGTDSYAAGGLFGILDNATIVNVNMVNASVRTTHTSNDPRVTFTFDIGILANAAFQSTVTNCHVSGTVSMFSSQRPEKYPTVNVGGLVGVSVSSKIMRCSVVATVSGTSKNYGDVFVSGLVGSIAMNGSGTVLENCFAIATLTTESTDTVSSTSGSIYNTTEVPEGVVSNCYGVITNNLGVSIDSDFRGSNCYVNKETNRSSLFELGGKTTAQMKTRATFEGWDFVNIWKLDPLINDGYPSFVLEPAVETNVFIKHSNVWKQAESIFIKQSGQWKKSDKMMAKNTNEWK